MAALGTIKKFQKSAALKSILIIASANCVKGNLMLPFETSVIAR